MPLLTADVGAFYTDFLFYFGASCIIGWLASKLPIGKRRTGKPILIDGSNVLHWRDGTPDITVLQQLLRSLQETGHRPAVVFDANVGYKISDRFMNDRSLAKLLGLPVKQVLVAPKGTPADPLILNAARNMQAAIISNDRFRDWLDTFPSETQAHRLIQGGVKRGSVYLKMPRQAAR
jgi:hypothetical protein